MYLSYYRSIRNNFALVGHALMMSFLYFALFNPCSILLTCVAQNDYLPLYDLLDMNTTGTVDKCFNCSSDAIDLGTPGIPFGSYYHKTAYVRVIAYFLHSTLIF